MTQKMLEADEAFATRVGTDPRDEPLPFLSNFQDVFLATGVVALLVGLAIGGASLTDAMAGMGFHPAALVIATAFVIGAVTWGLSELLVRTRRRVLPGIVLCLAFLACALSVLLSVYGVIFDAMAFDWDAFDPFAYGTADDLDPGSEAGTLRAVSRGAVQAAPWAVRSTAILLPGFALLVSAVYYHRFRLPFAIALVATSAIGVVLGVLFLLFPFDLFRFSPLVQLSSGLALFGAAIAYDAKDPGRLTRFAGNGFWLHFFAAPIVLGGALSVVQHGLAYDVAGLVDGDLDAFGNPFSVGQSVVTLLVIAVFAVVSLLVNRRALVVSGLLSAGVAIGVIVAQLGMGGAGIAAATLVILGGGVVLLGVGWNTARRGLLALVPDGGVWGRVFPRTQADG